VSYLLLVLTVRQATPADARAIAEVHIASWQAAYVGLIPQRLIDALDLEKRTARHYEHLQSGERPTSVACRDDGEVVAFASYGPSRDESADARTGELYALYAHPKAWGTGAGRLLTEHVFSALIGMGYASVIVFCLDENHRARRFYERAGFLLQEEKVPFPFFETTQARYGRALP